MWHTRILIRFARLSFAMVLAAAWLAQARGAAPAQAAAGRTSSGWSMLAPRDEIRPRFIVEAAGGRDGGECLVLEHDSRPGLNGSYEKEFPVEGGGWYRFSVARRIEGVDLPRQSCLVRIR
jgi:hypothetical protein